MPIISAFIGRSFNKEDEPLWGEISKFLDSLKRVGFKWEDAEESQAKAISDKVKEKIEKNDMFIGILTKREPICSKYISLGERYHLFGKTINWSTSHWVIQESGYAIGKGKKVIFLIEDGLTTPGGLNADFEYIIIDINNLQATFIKLNEIITNEIGEKIRYIEEQPRVTSAEITSTQKSEVVEQEKILEEKILRFPEVIKAIAEKKYSDAYKMFDALLEQNDFKDETRRRLAKIIFKKELYLSGRSEAYSELKTIADENPEDYYAVESLAGCLQFYDKYKEAEEEVRSYLGQAKNYDIRLKLSILLSAINIKLEDYGQAKQNLYPFFTNISSNSNEQNFNIYKALGDIYKEQGELDISCSLYEMALNYEPTNLSLRFRLAYDYDKIKKYALSAYHYKAYLKTTEDSNVMNNLGVEYQNLNLLGKSVWSYKKAIDKGESLANANLAWRYIEKGFYDEAKNILSQAIEKEDHHENVDSNLNHLKTSIEKEEEEENSILTSAKETRNIILEFAQAITIPFDGYEKINGLWAADYSDLKEFKIEFISPNILTGKHEFKYQSSITTFPSVLPSVYGLKVETETRIQKIIFSGTIINKGLKYLIKISTDSKSLLGGGSIELIGFGILSHDNQVIKFIIEKEGKFEFFTSKKMVND